MSKDLEEIKDYLEETFEEGYKAAAAGKTLEEAKQKAGLTTGETA